MTAAVALLLAAFSPVADGPPRLLRLDAAARYAPGGLTGTAALTVAGVGPLVLEPVGVAVLVARRADGSPLPLAPTATGLTVPVAGDSRLSLDWSARGDDRLALALPAAAVRTLDLDLPADRTPVAAAAVSGPFPGSAPDRRRWAVQFGGREPLVLELRPPPDPAAGQLVRADRLMRWELAPGSARWTAEFAVETVRGPVSALTFALPPGLTLTATDPPGGTTANGRVTVATTGGRVVLSGFAPPPAGPWTPPRVGLVGGLPGADTVVVSRSPELALVGCDPGGTRLTAIDAGRTLTFAGPGTPSLTAAEAGPEVRTTEEQTWRVGRDESVLTLKLTAAVTRGPLDRLTLVVPPGFAPTTVRAVPDDPGLTTTAVGDRLTVTPSQAVPAGGKLVLEAEFTAAPPVPAGDPAASPPPPLRVAAPTVGVEATDRAGTVGVNVGPGLHAWPTPPATPFRGRPLPAAVTLVAARTRVLVSSDITVSAVPGGLAVRATGLADPVDAPIGGLTLFVPAGWRVWADGAAVASVPGGELVGSGGLLAAADGWGVLAACGPAAALRGGLVRVTPPQPTTDPIRLHAVGFVTTTPQRVPLPVVLGADSRPPTVGLGRVPFDFDPPAGELPPVLELRPRGAAPPPAPGGWAFADPALTARVGPAGRELTFAVTVERAAGPVLPMGLPAGGEWVAATVAGKRAEVGPAGLPLPDAAAGTQVEVRYRLPADGWRATAVTPGLSADPGPVPVRWAFDADLRRWPTLDAPTESVVGGPEVWAVPATAVRLAGFLLAAVMVVAGVGRRRGLVLATGLLAAAGWVAPGGWREVARPPAAVGLLVLAVRRPRADVTPAAVRRLPSTASYGAVAVCLFAVGAAPPSSRIDTAEYDLTTASGGTAAGTARFTVTAPAAGPFTLPLVGVRLQAVELDGGPLLAAAAAGGYTFDLPAGSHTLTARFAVPVATTGGGRVVRFGVPDVPRCRVTVAGSPGGDVTSRRGVQRTDGNRLVADHGGGPVVEVKWLAVTPPTVVREAYVWDVAEGSSRGMFAVRVVPNAGPVAAVAVEVPSGVEVGSPTVRADSGPAPTASWQAGRVTLSPPSDRPVWLTLPLATVGPVLRCPTAGAAEGFAAMRGGPFAEVGRAGVIDFPADGLRAFADVPELRLATAPPARVFQRRPGQAAELTPKLAPPVADVVTAETVWTVGHTLTAAGTVRAERAPAGLVAFDLPSDVALLDVRAGDSTRWTRAGARVTVWLPGPTAEPTPVTWVGTLPGGPGERELPGAVPAGGGPATVRAVPADGWAAEVLPGSAPVRY